MQKVYNSISPQAKLIHLAKLIGAKSIEQMQGTTRYLYDALPLDGRTEFKFFRNVGTRAFPFTNMGESNGKLEVGEGLVVQRYFLSIVGIAADNTINSIATIDTLPNVAQGDLEFFIGNGRVLKPMPVSPSTFRFSKDAQNDLNSIQEFDTLLSIPPQIEFEFRLTLPTGPVVLDTFLFITVGGTGAILNTRQNY